MPNSSPPKPDWLRKKLEWQRERPMKKDLRAHALHSVCEEARCPNIGECFSKGVATIMIMGDVCTRACKFCNVKTGRPLALDPLEPENVARWASQYAFHHLVITSVDRDDLEDLGAEHFARVVFKTKEINPQTDLEILTPDFQGREACLDLVANTPIKVFNHNLETVRRLTPQVRSAAKYDRSLGVLKYVKNNYPRLLVKSGVMLGLGETEHEISDALEDLRASGCDIVTLGQYLQPTHAHLPVARYITPQEFDAWRERGETMGFKAVFSGPFVRSSYLADEVVKGIDV